MIDRLYNEKLAQEEQERVERDFGKLRRQQTGRGGLLNFVRYFWHSLEPKARLLVEGWPLEAITLHLEALTFGDIPSNRLLINVPPGFWERPGAREDGPVRERVCVAQMQHMRERRVGSPLVRFKPSSPSEASRLENAPGTPARLSGGILGSVSPVADRPALTQRVRGSCVTVSGECTASTATA